MRSATNFDLGPIHVFDVSGQVSAKLFAYYEIGFRAFGAWVSIVRKSLNSPTSYFLDFELPRPTANLVEHSYVDSSVLKFNTTGLNDQFTVRNGDNAGELIVESQGKREVKRV